MYQRSDKNNHSILQNYGFKENIPSSLFNSCGSFRPNFWLASNKFYQTWFWTMIWDTYLVPWNPEVFNSPRQILTLLDKVPGYWLQGETDFANKPRILQIFPHSKFGINQTAGSKVMAKNFKYRSRKLVCVFLGLFAKSVLLWSQ